MKFLFIGLAVLLVLCLTYIIIYLIRAGSSQSHNMRPAPSTQDNPLSRSQTAPHSRDGTHTNSPMAPSSGEGHSKTSETTPKSASKPQESQKSDEDSERQSTSNRTAEPTGDHAVQSTGVSDDEVVRGKTQAMSAFDFDAYLEEQQNNKVD